MLLIGKTRGDVEGARITGRATAAEDHVPQGSVGNDRTIGVLQLVNESAGGRIVDIDIAIAKFTDEQFAGKRAESGGRNHDTPRGIEISLGDQALNKATVAAENGNVASAGLVNGIMLGLILQCVGDVDLLIDEVNAEGSVTVRKLRVGEVSREIGRLKVGVKYIDGAGIEICGEQESAGLAKIHQRQALVDRTQWELSTMVVTGSVPFQALMVPSSESKMN